MSTIDALIQKAQPSSFQSFLQEFVPFSPTFTSVVPGRLIKLIEPEERRGTYAMVHLDKCGNDITPGSWCVQARGHAGPCWTCSWDLHLKTEGAWAKLVTDT